MFGGGGIGEEGRRPLKKTTMMMSHDYPSTGGASAFSSSPSGSGWAAMGSEAMRPPSAFGGAGPSLRPPQWAPNPTGASSAPGGSFGGFGLGAHPSSAKGGGQWSVGKSTAPRQPPRPAESGGLYVPPLANAGAARRPPPQQASKQLSERPEEGLFVPPDPGVLSSVLCWSPSPAPSARQSMLSLMAQSDSTAHSPSRRPTLTRKRAKSLHHPSAVDVATSVLREWQQGKLITAKINAVLLSWQIWNLYTGGRDVTQGLLSAVKTAMWPHLDARLYKPTATPPAVQHQHLDLDREVLQRRVTDMLSQGSEHAVCVVALCGEEVNVRSSRRFDQVFMSKESLEVGVVSKGDLPQNLWARVMKDQESLDRYWRLVVKASFEVDGDEDGATETLHVVDCFGVDSWEECTMGVYASADGLVACHWIILSPLLEQERPPAGRSNREGANRGGGGSSSGGDKMTVVSSGTANEGAPSRPANPGVGETTAV